MEEEKIVNKDWKGNGHTMVCLGVHNYSDHEREVNDLYCTDPKAINYLFKMEEFGNNILEPFCGLGHLSKRMTELGKNVLSTDLIERGFGIGGVDFFGDKIKEYAEALGIFDIISNPPYSTAKQCIEKGMELLKNGCKMAMFLRIQFLESKGRYELWKKYPPQKIYVFSGRIGCAMNGEFENKSQSAVPYAWYVFQKGYTGPTIVDWILVDK